MALINLQTQQPSLKKSIVSSSVFRPNTPIASVAKIPFGGVAKAIGAQPKSLQVDKLDVPDDPSPLYGIIDALKIDVQSLRQEQAETSEIIGDIGNALATDFANRITEEKAQNTKLNKERYIGNFGYGKRYLGNQNTSILGFNTFLDYDHYGNSRASIGGELKNAVLEFSTKYYNKIENFIKVK